MQLYKRIFQIGFVLSLSLFFVHCSSIIDDIVDDDYELVLQAPHTYDIKFTRGDEILHYAGSVISNQSASRHYKDGGRYSLDTPDNEVVTLTIKDGDDFIIVGVFPLDKKGVPLPLQEDGLDHLDSGSFLSFSNLDGFIFGKSGTVSMSNFKSLDISDMYLTLEGVASYTLQFEGEFIIPDMSGGEIVKNVYSGIGKIVINPFKKQY